MINSHDIIEKIKTLEDKILASQPSDNWTIGEQSIKNGIKKVLVKKVLKYALILGVSLELTGCIESNYPKYEIVGSDIKHEDAIIQKVYDKNGKSTTIVPIPSPVIFALTNIMINAKTENYTHKIILKGKYSFRIDENEQQYEKLSKFYDNTILDVSYKEIYRDQYVIINGKKERINRFIADAEFIDAKSKN